MILVYYLKYNISRIGISQNYIKLHSKLDAKKTGSYKYRKAAHFAFIWLFCNSNEIFFAITAERIRNLNNNILLKIFKFYIAKIHFTYYNNLCCCF